MPLSKGGRCNVCQDPANVVLYASKNNVSQTYQINVL